MIQLEDFEARPPALIRLFAVRPWVRDESPTFIHYERVPLARLAEMLRHADDKSQWFYSHKGGW